MIGGCQVDGDVPVGHLEAGIAERGPHALACLACGGVGKADEGEPRQPGADIDLADDGEGFETPQGGGAHACEHASTPRGRRDAEATRERGEATAA